MTTGTRTIEKVRVQVDLSQAEASMLELLQSRLAVRSRADLLQQAYGTFLWVLDEMLRGRHVISVDEATLTQVDRFKELSVPAVQPQVFDHFRYLEKRPSAGRAQPYLKGRNMTVGQLVYKMRANQLTAEEAALDMALPLHQVKEAVAYYHVHRDEIDGEAEADRQHLLSQGFLVEPEPLS
jgi:uncharacterized protein (DUF433 family)